MDWLKGKISNQKCRHCLGGRRFIPVCLGRSRNISWLVNFHSLLSVAVDNPDPPVIVWLEQNLADWTAKLQSLPADPTDYLTSGNIVTSTIVKHSPANWTALALDYHNRVFFWADPQRKLIWHGELNGAQLVAIPMYRGTSKQVTGIAVDWLARSVFWTDAAYNWIMVSNYEGSRRSVVIEGDLDTPSGITVHPQLGLVLITSACSHKSSKNITPLKHISA